MKMHATVLLVSILALSGQAAMAAESSAPESRTPVMGGFRGGKMHKFREMLQEEGMRKREGYGEVVLRHTDELKLSDEQIGKIVRIHQANQRKIGEIGAKLHAARRTAYSLFLNPANDEAAIRNAAREHAAAFDELVDTALKSRAAIHAVLTPEQLNQLKSFKTEP